MKKAISALPQFQETKTRYAAHLHIAHSCMEKFKNENLATLAVQEQNLVTGQTSDGVSLKHETILKEIMPLLTDSSITSNAKARLIMLYFMTKRSIDKQEMNTLVHYAGLNGQDVQSVENMSLFGVPILGQNDNSLLETAKSLKKAKAKFSKKSNETISYELSRYVPPIKTILEDFCTNQLSNMNFPIIPDPAGISSALRGGDLNRGGAGTSLRQKATYKTSKDNGNSDKDGRISSAHSGSKLILLIIGGITYSEMLWLYKIAQEKQRDLILVGTHILTPGYYMKAIAALNGGTDAGSFAPLEGSSGSAKLNSKKNL